MTNKDPNKREQTQQKPKTEQPIGSKRNPPTEVTGIEPEEFEIVKPGIGHHVPEGQDSKE